MQLGHYSIIIIDFFELLLKIIDMDKVGPVGTFGLIWVTPAALPGSPQPAISPGMHNIYWPVRNTYENNSLMGCKKNNAHEFEWFHPFLCLNNLAELGGIPPPYFRNISHFDPRKITSTKAKIGGLTIK